MNHAVNIRFYALFLVLAVAAGCQPLTINDTVYPYMLNQQALGEKPIKTVVIVEQNLGAPSKSYLQPYEPSIDKVMAELLTEAGFTVLANDAFSSAWRNAVRKHGQPYDNYSSQLNKSSLRRVLYDCLAALKEEGGVDAIIFTDLVERNVRFVPKQRTVARWDGVSRELRTRGRAQPPLDFDWAQTVPAISIHTVVYSVDGKTLFKSMGGLEVSRELDTKKSSGRYVRREHMLNNAGHLKQGVALSLHPLVPIDHYPKDKDQ